MWAVLSFLIGGLLGFVGGLTVSIVLATILDFAGQTTWLADHPWAVAPPGT